MLISVIMPVYNGIAYLDKSIRSILNQTYEDFEFIVIDDASTEPIWELLSSYSDDRLILCKNTKNIGLTRSLNRYLGLAHGEVIARHDGDDIALPTRFQEEMAAFEDGVGLVSCWAKAIDPDGSFVKSPWEDGTAHITSEEVAEGFKVGNCVVAPGAIFRREVIPVIGYFDEAMRLAQDYNYWLRLIQHFNIKIVEKVLVWKRLHENNVWNLPVATETDWLELARQRAKLFPYCKYGTNRLK